MSWKSERSRMYLRWAGMVARCHHRTSRAFRNYGARGIHVADEWRGLGGFARFVAHIGEPPSTAHTIDRIDNARGYEPGNVRWATREVQSRNTRRNVLVTVNGRTKCLEDWLTEVGDAHGSVRWAIRKGVRREDAIATALPRVG